MKIAYIILAHKLPEQLIRLVKALHSDFADFFIHIDKKLVKEFNYLHKHLLTYPNLSFLKRKITHRADFSLVQVTNMGIEAALKQGIDYDYIILLSGQCYPIKSNQFIYDFFSNQKGKSFINSFPLPYEQWKDGGYTRLRNLHITRFGHHLEIEMNRNMPLGLIPFGGSQWWNLTREVCQYIMKYQETHRELDQFFRFVRIPDELYYQTILNNSPFSESLINNNLRFIDWSRKETPAIFGKDDFDLLAESDALFARKFDICVDVEILDMIDEKLL